MPIKGVSDIRRLPRLGKIRLGEKELARSGKEYPKAVDYFVCPPEVQKVYGEKPRVLDIMFPVDDSSVFFPQWYKRYGQSTGLICKGDGEVASFIDTETGEMVEMDCVPDECEAYAKKHCRRLANLQFLLPKVPGLGVWTIDTTSFYSIININSALEMIRAVAGRIHMLPLQLVLKPQEVSPDGRKKTVYVMDLLAPVTLSKLIAAGQTSPAKLLMPALDEDDRPEDLYPDGILNKEDREPFTIDAKPVQPEKPEQPPEPASQTPPPAASRSRGGSKGQKKETKSGIDHNKMSEDDNAFWEQHAPPPAEEDPIDAELAKAWDILGLPPAKREAQLAKMVAQGSSKKALLAFLHGEIDKRVAQNDAPGTPSTPPPQQAPRQHTPPSAPPPVAAQSAQPGLFF